MPTQVRLVKWDSGLAVPLPHEMVDRLGLTEGAWVDIEASHDRAITVTRSLRRFTLDELLIGMTPEREHTLKDDG
jgi:antitoxin MazE